MAGGSFTAVDAQGLSAAITLTAADSHSLFVYHLYCDCDVLARLSSTNTHTISNPLQNRRVCARTYVWAVIIAFIYIWIASPQRAALDLVNVDTHSLAQYAIRAVRPLARCLIT